jgi:hypothetical protein
MLAVDNEREGGVIGNMVNKTPIGVVCALRITAGDIKHRGSPNVRNIKPVDCDVLADFLNVVADGIEVWTGLRKETQNE